MSSATESVARMPTGEIREKKAINTRILICLFMVLAVIGTINLWSGTAGGAIFYAQLRHLALGFVAFIVCAFFVHPRHLATYAYWLFGAICALLIAVLAIGRIGGGAQRWIDLGFIGMQPSEPAKVIVAIVTARFFAVAKQSQPYRIRDMWPLLAMLSILFLLIFTQPDLGTACLVAGVGVVQICFMRIDRRTIGAVVLIAMIAIPIVWVFFMYDYQKLRVINFLNPEYDVKGTGYNALQSLVAIGSGGLNGKGFMAGTQTQLSFLPKGHTDFVFSVFAEEHGFKGGALLFLLFGGIAYVALEIARQAKDMFSAQLAVGLAAFIFFEFVVNVGMVLRMFPIVGIPLPFFTYGGSILLTVCAALGMLVSIDRDNLGRFRRPASLGRKR